MVYYSQPTHLLLIFTVLGTRHAAVKRVAAEPLYPSSSFGPSMKASATASTIVAVTAPVSGKSNDAVDDGECCVVLTKSHVKSAGRDGERGADEGKGTDDDDTGGLTVASVISRAKESPTGMSSESEMYPIIKPGRHTPTLSILSTGSNVHGCPPLLAGFTGFTPDVHHIILRMAKIYSNHMFLYGGIPMRSDKVSRALADVLRSEASGEGRPYGLQALVVGDRPKSKELQLYTIDPAGGCTHWSGGGTAVGKDAELVRKCLLRCLRPTNGALKRLSIGDIDSPGTLRGPTECWKDALDRAMMALLEASLSGTDADTWLDEEDFHADSFRAVVAFTGGAQVGDTKTFGLCSTVLEESHEKCKQALANERR